MTTVRLNFRAQGKIKGSEGKSWLLGKLSFSSDIKCIENDMPHSITGTMKQ